MPRSRICHVRRTSVLIAIVLTCAIHGAAHAQHADAAALASPRDVAQAQPIRPFLVGRSASEPDVCAEGASREQVGVRPGGGIGVSPAAWEIAGVKPGERYVACLLVHNMSDEPVRFEITTVDIHGSPDPRNQIELDQSAMAAGSWVHPVTRTISAGPGERVRVPYVIQVSPDPPAGTTIAGVKVSERGEGAGARVGAGVVQRVYFTFPGGRSLPLEISDIDAPRLMTRRNSRVNYRAKFVVRNVGDTLDVYEPTLEVSGLGRTIVRVSGKQRAILPGGANDVTLTWKRIPWIGWYSPKVTIRSDVKQQTIQLPRVLVVPPLPYTIALVAAILLPLGALGWRWRKRRSEWKAYLDEELAEDGYAEENAAEHDYWDPTRPL